MCESKMALFRMILSELLQTLDEPGDKHIRKTDFRTQGNGLSMRVSVKTPCHLGLLKTRVFVPGVLTGARNT